jgi:hypothetical protein
LNMMIMADCWVSLMQKWLKWHKDYYSSAKILTCIFGFNQPKRAWRVASGSHGMFNTENNIFSSYFVFFIFFMNFFGGYLQPPFFLHENWPTHLAGNES